ncbi:hypothetical protein [Pararobbsia alpina]|uniref:Uncharacterized protein n=1 Tax=Pararobbsia alpina TaxID=621374 RepID=A0A6S7BK27_9BURK|nr:hypothetical protein [Pararobbsia alpina]CAB3793981.1 hypothetical protein LMG28138_03622 [Pararobbsia alpina]
MRILTTEEGLPRVSWGAVIAGVILSLVVYLILGVLGTGIGASLVAPMSQPNPLRGFGFGSGVWIIITTVLAVVTGSYFAGRCAPVLGWLHGLLAWAVTIILVTSAMGSLVGGTASMAADMAAGTAMPSLGQASDAVAQAMNPASAVAAMSDSDRATAEAAARTVARASWFSFAALIVGGIIAVTAGNLGFRHRPLFEDAGGDTDSDPTLHGAVRTERLRHP